MAGNRPTFVNQLMEMWNRLLWPQRITILLSGVLGLAVVGSLVYFMNRVEYETVWSDLNPEDKEAIYTKLKEQKKDVMVSGSSILVAAPQKEIGNLQVEIGRSVTSGRPGYEIFDKNQFGMTDFIEQVNLQRALEGELARTISSLSEISQARVHIVLPKDSMFEDKKEDAKASVFVTLKRGTELTKASIAGIKGVLAGAVPELHRSNISIVDDEGRLLSQSVESGEGAHAEMESSLREQYEKEMAGKVISILEPVVGKGKVHANASIDLDINTTEQMEETYNPNPQIVLSQQKSQERTGGGGSAASGVPGTQSNTGSATPQMNALPTHERQSESTNYEVNKVVRHVVQPKGTIRRLSVAVILDHEKAYTKGKDGKVTSISKPRSPQDIEAYKQLVLAAVGYNQQRGDVVTIENVPFFSDAKPEEPQPASPWYVRFHSQPYTVVSLKYGSFLLLFVLAYLFLFRPVHKKVFEAMSVAALRAGGPVEPRMIGEAATRALPGERQPDELPAAAIAGAAGLPEGESHMEEMAALQGATDEQIEQELIREANIAESGGRKYAVIKKRLSEKARKDPEMISQLIRSLLKEKA
jgi:flagellar M-ring protein FliF